MAYSIDYLYRIRDRYSSVLDKMSKSQIKFQAGANKISSKLGTLQTKFQNTGAKLASLQTGLAALGAGVFLKSTLSEVMEFQKSLNLTQAVTGATNDQMDIMKAKALEWGSQTQFSSKQVAAAMGELGKMGNDTNQILSLMPGTMALAAAGELDMADAANFTMGILNQFGRGLEDAGLVADILATGASGAATSVGGIASAMNNAGLTASMAGLNIRDTTVALMAMASKNIEGAEAGTLFKNAMKSLIVMTDKTRGGFAKMGINIDQFRDSTTGQVTDFFGLITAMKATGEEGQKLMAETFDIRAMQAFAAITGTSAEQMNVYRDSLADVDGAAEKMKNTLNKDMEHLIQFQSIMQNLKVIMGAFLSEALVPVLTKFNQWMGNMQTNHPVLLKTITLAMVFVTALGAILIPLGLLISSIGTIIGLIKTSVILIKLWTGVQIAFNAVMSANPIALVIIAIAALVAATILIIKHWDKVTAALSAAWNWFVKVYDIIKPLIVILGGPIIGPLIFFIEVIRSLVSSWNEIKAAFMDQGFIAGLKAIGQAIFNGLIAPFAAFKDLIDKIQGGVGGAAAAIKELFGKSEGGAAVSPYAAASPYAPGLARQAMNIDANASVSVYTESEMSVQPFKPSGNLGYNMSGSESRSFY